MATSHDVLVVIPARMESKRLPGKPLLDCGGKPLLWHTWQAGVRWAGKDQTCIVTDSQTIQDAAEAFGANVLLQSGEFRCGSDRIFAALSHLPKAEFIVDLQCDEPRIMSTHFDALLEDEMAGSDIATLVAGIYWDDKSLQDDPSIVKAVVSRADMAMYFTRKPTPGAVAHVGVYGFRSQAISRLSQCGNSEIADAEDLEQMRWMDYGWPIATRNIYTLPMSINTPEDLARFRSFSTPEDMMKLRDYLERDRVTEG